MTEPSKQSGGDPIGDLQRWLVRSSARSVTRQVRGQIRTALGGGAKPSNADVWETATSDYDESPECAWCPICRARRRLRESGPGLGSGVAAAADAVGVVMQDAMSAFEAAVAAAGRPARPRDTTAQPPGEVWDEATDEPAVRTRPPANGSAGRPPGSRPTSAAWPQQPSAAPQPSAGPQPSTQANQPSAGVKPSSAEAKPPSAEAKPPSAGSKQSSADAKSPSGKAKQPPAGAKKPAPGAKKPSARPDGSAAADRTPPDKSTAGQPDEPTG